MTSLRAKWIKFENTYGKEIEGKTCRKCNEIRPMSDYERSHASCRLCLNDYRAEWKKKNRIINREKANAKARAYRMKNPDKTRQTAKKSMAKKDKYGLTLVRRAQLKYYYNLTPEEYMELYNKQNGRCAISGVFSNNLAVDHNHETNEIRGLVLNKLNLGMSYFDDNPALLRAAADYLERARSTLSKKILAAE